MMEKPRVMKTINGVGSSQERSLELELQPSLSCSSFVQQESKLRVDVSADEDTEISIFDAQKYFNESNSDARVCKRVSPLNMPNLGHISSEPGCDISDLAAARRFSSASSAAEGCGYGIGRTPRVRSFHATPTVSSEASWNSQTGLLSNPPGAIAVTMKNPTTDHKRKGSGKIKWLWGRRCPCPCAGKKSVQVEPKTPSGLNQKLKIDYDHKSLGAKCSRWGGKREEILLACNPHKISAENQFHSSIGQRVVASATARPLMIRDGSGTAGFTFPILNQQPTSSHIKMAMNRNNSSVDDDHEDPPRDSLEVFRPSDESSSISVPKKLVSRVTITDDDVGSDTSSDLFEIESFSTTTQSQTTSSYPIYHRRDSLDEASNFNIRRSIAAAGNGCSGFGCPYSPMMTECYEPSEASIDWSVTTAEGFERGSVGVSEAEEMIITAHGKKKSGNGGLLSCRWEKAVSVGPNPVKCVPPHPHPHPLGQDATTSKHVGNVNKPPLARLSLPFAP